MRSPFHPPLWVGFAVMAVVAGAQIPDGVLMEESLVAPPPETSRHLQAPSASRHDGHLMNAMSVEDEDDEISDEGGSICYMEVQVTRRIPGRCVSLGRSRGCVAGIYLHAYHHECQ
ncbi:uncharacterized protein LOC124158433 isoform X3 [Ischnura elegans]|nr:uncharacterized protein LOC124158433 isoform X3 [Ischnura elegans]XP_046389499.1 uncharacterized protein LOC124158433 isoform X3 [Ischnura elegans]